jgi:DNA-binding NtrC family response regulator
LPQTNNVAEYSEIAKTAICDGTIHVKDLPERVQKFRALSEQDSPPAAETDDLPLAIVEEWPSLSTIEGHYVEKVLAHTGGNKQAAARLLDIDRKTLDRMIKRHKLLVERVARFPTPTV